MNLTLRLGPDIEARLRERAESQGKAPEAIAMEALEDVLNADSPSAAALTGDDWHERLDALLASLPRSEATFVDDSRESSIAAAVNENSG